MRAHELALSIVSSNSPEFQAMLKYFASWAGECTAADGSKLLLMAYPAFTCTHWHRLKPGIAMAVFLTHMHALSE
eukprot:SAG22_NODE_1258_length_4983_cov_2.401925_5_plen_75_part_00